MKSAHALRLIRPAWIGFFLLFVWGFIPSFSHAGDISLVRPFEGASARFSFEKPAEAYVARRGWISLDLTGMTPERNIGAEDVLTVSFFPDTVYRVVLRSISHPPGGGLLLSGAVEGRDLDLFSLTVGEKGFLITLHDMAAGFIYRAVGSRLSETGSVMQIDALALPPARGMPSIRGH